jgi:hypothetical protein
MKAKILSKAEQYELWDEYCKLIVEEENEEEYMEDENELGDHVFYDYSDCHEDYEEEHEELSVFDLAPEGMGYEYFSDDEYLGDVGYW